MQSELIGRENEFLVLLEEEYGYKYWFWFPKMNQDELEIWWETLETVDPYFMSPEPLPGDVIFAENMDYWHALEEAKRHFTGHIHCDDDSWLKKPTGEYIYHKGYDGERT